MRLKCFGFTLFLVSALASGQDAQSIIQSLKSIAPSGLSSSAGISGDVIPGKMAPNLVEAVPDNSQQALEDAQINEEIARLKAREKGPRRFAADLFQVRQRGRGAVEGGISDDYVLGTGDRLNISTFGSASFDVLAQVDGRGMLIIPKIGTVKVGGESLEHARQAVQGLVKRNFSNTSVDIQAIKLREVRVFVMGEVYKPGSYLVPSLSSLVNILSLAGGPNALGSYRQVRVIRGGKPVHVLDLYPYRAEGIGNMNFYLENGDTVFVPLASRKVTLEGAFTRVVAAVEAQPTAGQEDPGSYPGEPRDQRDLRREISRLDDMLRSRKEDPSGALPSPATGGKAIPSASPQDPPKAWNFTPKEWSALVAKRDELVDRLQALRLSSRGDLRVRDAGVPAEEPNRPDWFVRWQVEGIAPSMEFEMLPNETVADAVKFAGGVHLQGVAGRLTLRSLDPEGGWSSKSILLNAAGTTPVLQDGDVLTALPRREGVSRTVTISGWARVPGVFSRTEGLRSGDLLARESELLPDTYLERAEITRQLADGTTAFLSFNVGKAIGGDPLHNLLLEDRDRIELYRIADLKLRKTLTVVGPVKRPGVFDFHEGMRVSDLLFRAGVPERNADQYVAELSRTRNGQTFEVKRLDLSKLLSTDTASPITLKDDTLNPSLEPFDQVSIFSRPDFRPTRTVTLSGQVVRPGTYTLESTQTTLKDLVNRAGGLTPEAMPEAAVYLRKMWQIDPDKARVAELSGVPASDPTSNGINQTLERLNETKRNPLSGLLLTNPLLHGLQTGSLSRLVVDIPALLRDGKSDNLELQDGDEVIFPTRTSVAYVVGEAASPFSAYKVIAGMSVDDLIKRAGGITRNADRGAIRLLKANGQIVDSWVTWQKVAPGDTVLIPQRIRRDSSWQENLQALTPIAILLNAIQR